MSEPRHLEDFLEDLSARLASLVISEELEGSHTIVREAFLDYLRNYVKELNT